MAFLAKLFRSRIDNILREGSDEVLHGWLKAHPVFVPSRPLRMLDAGSFTQDELQALMKEEADRLARIEVEGFRPWVVNGEFLPVFVDRRGREAFTRKVGRDLGKVFCAGCIQVNLFAPGIIDGVSRIVIQPFLATERTIEITRRAPRQPDGAAAVAAPPA